MVTSIVSKARRNNIARVSSNLAQSTSIVRSRLHSRHRDMSAKGLRDESKVEVAEKKAKKGLKMAVEILGRSGEGDHTQLIHLVKWMNTGKKRNGTHYCHYGEGPLPVAVWEFINSRIFNLNNNPPPPGHRCVNNI